MPRAALLACAALVLLCLVDTGAGAAEVDAGTDSAAAAAAGAGPVAAAPAPPAAPAAPAEAEAAAGPDGAKASDGARGPAAAAEGDAGGEDLGVNMEYVMIGAGAVGTLCCMAGGWFLLNQGGPKKRKFRGDAVFLVGPCDSGKTAVMFQLRDGESGDNKLRPTHTSMALNEETFAVAGIDCKPVRVIDFPGHSRLRPQLFDMIEDCRALIFVVDCSTFSSKGQGAVDRRSATRAAAHAAHHLRVLCVRAPRLCDDCVRVFCVRWVCAPETTAREIGSFVLDLLTSEKLLKVWLLPRPLLHTA